MKKILLATDFSEEAQLATGHAVAMARQAGAEIILLHAMNAIEPMDPEWIAARPELQSLYDLAHERSVGFRDMLEALRASIAEQGVAVSKAFIEGDPAGAICNAAQELEADLVVLGTHGRTGLKRLVLGSVAAKVMRRATTSVFIARGDRSPPERGYQRLLVPIDFSSGSEAALKTALELVGPGGTIELFHVVDPPFAFTDQNRVLDANLENLRAWAELARAQAEGQASKLAASMDTGETDVNIVTGIVEDFPAQGLIKRMEYSDYDVVVLGVREGGLRLLGSLSEAALRHAPCPVVIARN